MKLKMNLQIGFLLLSFLLSSLQPASADQLANPYYPKFVGQCTWYAAEMRPDLRFNTGNGASWAAKSSQNSYVVDTIPEVGAIAVWAPNKAGAYGNGHVAYVVNVRDNTHFRVQEYNWGMPLAYGERDVTWKDGIQFIHTSSYSSGISTYTPPPPPDPFVSYIFSASPSVARTGEQVTITAGAQEAAGHRTIDSINVFLNDRLLGNISGNSGNFIWETSGYQPGTYAVSLHAQVNGWTGTVSQKSFSYTLQESTTGSAVPAAPDLASPNNGGSLLMDTEVMLKWNSVPEASQYKVELWGGDYSLMTPCDWQNNTSCQIGTLWSGHTYSWHVKSRNSSRQESAWSGTWTFSIQGPTQTPAPTAIDTPTPRPQAPSAPSLRDPAHRTSYPPSQDVWFAWNYVPDVTQYYLEYWGGPYGTLNSGWINDGAYHIGTMWPGTYKWHVKARGQNGLDSSWSETWTFTVTQPESTSIPPTVALPTAVPPTAIPPTDVPPPTSVSQPGFIVLLDELTLRTESGNWPPQSGQKILAHIKIQNGGDLPIHIQHIGVRGRRNGSESWDIGFWTIDLNGHDVWSLDPNNERPLQSGNYSFRISYSLEGSNWTELGREINFTVP